MENLVRKKMREFARNAYERGFADCHHFEKNGMELHACAVLVVLL